jgi:phosphoribosylformimino-5-aminoimidazole carboxamide ribotide isomerase
LRELEDVEKAIDLGVARIVIGTLAVESPEILKTLLRLFGSERVAVGIDSRNGQVVTRGWENDTARSAVNFALHLASFGVERIVYTDVLRDGMLNGIDVGATCEIARACGLKVTASGGVSSLEDIRRVSRATCGIDSMIIGKALYEGYFTIQEALVAANQ